MALYFSTSQDKYLLSTASTAEGVQVDIEFLNEGGANAVFAFKVSDRHGTASASNAVLPDRGYITNNLENLLLRVRKSVPHALYAESFLSAFEEHFGDIFTPAEVVNCRLITLGSGACSVLNRALVAGREKKRAIGGVHLQKGHGKQMGRDVMIDDEEKQALIMPNLTPPGGKWVNFKPKWLQQSPDAPANANRCRTCALRALRENFHGRPGKGQFCPLSLVSKDLSERLRAAEALTPDKDLQNATVHSAQHLINKLAHWQGVYDKDGILGITRGSLGQMEREEKTQNLCKAMTLRDCTLYILLPETGPKDIEVRLGDLDLKLPTRLDEWDSTEWSLQCGGWYEGPETICALSR
ncbi:hypothetical protein K470DRAFT_256301 [Piedraia hortae CBS 480.64]|uniref:Inositol-pentakisphosphate 2-kinase n=1 Tax=Piedraia hortae CBS 480.64 TaxID=1314780 RepID=A0A6A7C515_9PEZI|nr:hypothetical protein K470DRAFT_256301 [Piedraia hortae CBS 480.64]